MRFFGFCGGDGGGAAQYNSMELLDTKKTVTSQDRNSTSNSGKKFKIN